MTSINEKFCLKWNDFQENINSSFKELREGGDFSDVTLVCQDDQLVEAHRVILSACSPVLQNILKKNQHNHPLIYMRGLKAKHLFAIVDFMYQGEANIYQEDLDGFLSLAEELQLKGLSGGNDDNESTQNSSSANELESTKLDTKLKPLVQSKSKIKFESFASVALAKEESLVALETSHTSTYKGGIVSIPTDAHKITYIDDADELDEKINLMMLKVEGKWSCSVCGKIDHRKSNMIQHIEANHIEGVTHTCNQCGKTSRSRNALCKHVAKEHMSK